MKTTGEDEELIQRRDDLDNPDMEGRILKQA
jgi:hypothetical protein